MSLESNDIFQNLMNYSKDENTSKKTTLKPSDKLLLEIKNYGFNMSQLETVLRTTGNQLIVSCAGSGKTTSLIFKIIYDLKTGRATRIHEVNGNKVRIPEKIWVSTFLKTGAEELEASLRKWQRKLHCSDTSNAIMFSTLHAEFKRVLNLMGIKTDIISASENSKLLKDAVKGYSLYNSNGKPLNSEDYRNLEGALTYTRNRLDNDRYEHDVYNDLSIGAPIIDAILRDWKAMRIKEGMCDFEDLQERLYYECYERNNQEVINFLADRYNFIYIDEFQDTSQIQYALLKIYGSQSKQVVAIGDDDQTIYSWRGSDNTIITTKFLEDFNPVKNDLSINFRCPENILNAIKPSIANNVNRFEKDLNSYKEGGKVRYGGFANYKQMVSTLSDLVYEDVKNNKSVAILCRVNSDGLMPALILDKLDRFSFSISGDGMTLDSYIGRTVLSIIKLFTERCTPSVKSALSMLTWDTYCINNLMKVFKANKLSIWSIDEKDLFYSCPSIAERVISWRKWKDSMGEVQALKLVLQDYRVSVFGKNTQFNDVVRSVISSIEALLDYFDYDYVEDFLIELEDINERLKARKKSSNAQIRIATVHEFKGKEADSVYVWNDSEDVFPYRGSEDNLNEFEEERRVHYIANTRAKETNTVMYLRTKPGYFISEMDFSKAEEISGIGSGSVSGQLKGKMEEESGLQHFEKVMSESSTESFMTDEDEFDDNPFWESSEEGFDSRYDNAFIDFEKKMRAK